MKDTQTAPDRSPHGSTGRRFVGWTLVALWVIGTGFVLLVVYGVTAEYGGLAFGGFAVQVASAAPYLLVVGLVGAGGLTLLRLGLRTVVLAVVTGLVVMFGGTVVALLAGQSAKEQNRQETSDRFACSSMVEEDVASATRDLPRPYPVHGPVEESATSCTQAVDLPTEVQDEGDAIEVYSAHLEKAGWQVQSTSASTLTATRDGLVVQGRSEGGVLLLEVSRAAE